MTIVDRVQASEQDYSLEGLQLVAQGVSELLKSRKIRFFIGHQRAQSFQDARV